MHQSVVTVTQKIILRGIPKGQNAILELTTVQHSVLLNPDTCAAELLT